MVLIFIYGLAVVLMLFLSLLVMSSIDRTHEELYERLGGMESTQLPITHLRFFWFVLSGKYINEIHDAFARRTCHIIRIVEFMILTFIVLQMALR